MRQAAELTVFTGSMFASKTSALISKGERHLIAGQRVVYCKPAADTRYSETELVTHSGMKVPAITLDEIYYKLYIREWIKVFEADVVLIDEVQFFSEEIIKIVQDLLTDGKIVYVAGLDLDFLGEPFNVTAQLMGLADNVQKLQAVCSECGKDSYQTAKIAGTAERLELGGKESYIPVCRECYKLLENETTESAEHLALIEEEGI